MNARPGELHLKSLQFGHLLRTKPDFLLVLQEMTKQMPRCLMMLAHPESTFVASHGGVIPVGAGETDHAEDQEHTDRASRHHSHEHEFLLV